MNDTEFEDKVKVLLNDIVDAEIGTARPAPELRSDSELEHRPGHGAHRRWIVPLLAAACVAIVVAATWGLSAVFRGNGKNPPAQPPRGPVIVYAGAHIALPSGWAAHKTHPKIVNTRDPAQMLCVRRTGSKTDDCTIVVLGRTLPTMGLGSVDVDAPFGNRPQCGSALKLVEHAGEVPFGGRTSEHRRFDYSCPARPRTRIEQYILGYLPFYAMVSDRASASVSAAMAYIAAHSTLPKAQGGLRLSDYGRVVAVTHTPHGDKILLERQIRTAHAPGGARIVYGHVTHAQIRYDLTPVYQAYKARRPPPPAAFFAGIRVHVGDHLEISTDSRHVLAYLKA